MFLHSIFCGLSFYVCFFTLFLADCFSMYVSALYFLRTVVLCMFLHSIFCGLSFYVCFFMLFPVACHSMYVSSFYFRQTVILLTFILRVVILLGLSLCCSFTTVTVSILPVIIRTIVWLSVVYWLLFSLSLSFYGGCCCKDSSFTDCFSILTVILKGLSLYWLSFYRDSHSTFTDCPYIGTGVLLTVVL